MIQPTPETSNFFYLLQHLFVASQIGDEMKRMQEVKKQESRVITMMQAGVKKIYHDIRAGVRNGQVLDTFDRMMQEYDPHGISNIHLAISELTPAQLDMVEDYITKIKSATP